MVESSNSAQSKSRLWVVGQMLLITAILIVSPWTRGQWPPLLAFGCGAALMLYAAFTGLAGVSKLGRNLTPLPKPRAGGELVTTGIYGLIRHPLYASVMAMGCSWALLWSSTIGVVLAIVLILYIHAKARYEEKLLHAAYPDYAEYTQRVPRYLPTVKALTKQ